MSPLDLMNAEGVQKGRRRIEADNSLFRRVVPHDRMNEEENIKVNAGAVQDCSFHALAPCLALSFHVALCGTAVKQ